MKRIYHIFLCYALMLIAPYTFAQYEGGDGDGVDNLELDQQFLDGFIGGSEFNGGDGDGFSVNVVSQQFLDGFVGGGEFLGGDGDGFSLGTISEQPLGGIPTCDISELAAGDQTVSGAVYDQQVIVTFSEPPDSGNLVVNGVSVAIGTSPQTVLLTGLPADGLPVDVTAGFTEDTTCSLTVDSLFVAPMATALDDELSTVAVFSAFPNPFSQEVAIQFQVKSSEHVSLEIYTLEGKKIASLFDNRATANHTYEVVFEAPKQADGIYFCRLQTNVQVLHQKLVVLP